MAKEDIYAPETVDREHSLRFIHILARNVVGILNRIASLMRRKRYNMEEVSVAFDDQGLAHITIAIDGRLVDVQQAIEQIHKLHDVFDVRDATSEKEKLYDAIYVRGRCEEDFSNFPFKPLRVFCGKDGCSAIFIVSFEDSPKFMHFVHEKKLSYVRRILSLI